MGRPKKWQGNPMLQKLVNDARQREAPINWLDLQDANRYKWQEIIGQSPETSGRRAYYRRLGIVEGIFDSDGSLSCGRADLHQNHYYEFKTSLNDKQLRERLILVWTLMRHSHVLMASQALYLHEIVPRSPSYKWTEKCFLYRCPRSLEKAVEETKQHVIFVDDGYPELDPEEFFQHHMNANRALDPKTALSRLYVLPITRTAASTTARLHFIPVLAHQITDGLTMYRWSSHLAHILNMSEKDIKHDLNTILTDPKGTSHLLPPSQESLYPIRSTSLPRQRWHWLITRILRHVRTPPPGGFPNPLRRDNPLSKAEPYPPTYDKILDYTTVPPLNAGHCLTFLQGKPILKLRSLCRQAKISIGSGCFTLVATVMMTLYESQHPDIPLSSRLPFVTGFPVDPRPFLSTATTGKENSCMLAFSDGITLPFLPSSAPFPSRFRVLGRLVHKQLRQFQKRSRTLDEEVSLGSRSPSQLLPALYCSTLERLDSRYPDDQKAGVNVQGKYPARSAFGSATCGVSAVGSIAGLLTPPIVNLDESVGAPADNDHDDDNKDKKDAKMKTKDLIAKFEDMVGGVRPRDGEFLVGIVGDARNDSFAFNVSYDACAIDPEKVKEWTGLMHRILEDVDVNGANGGDRAKL